MQVTFLGTGTSQGVPVVACPCIVCRSKDPKDNRLRSSILVEDGGKVYVIDTGPDFRYQMLRAGVKSLDAVIFTHEHKDHIAGFDDIRAFNYVLKKKIDVYATERVQQAMKREFAYIFDGTDYPGIPQINLFTIDNKPFVINITRFIPIEVKHFKLPVLGFRIGDFTYITDANFISEEVKEKIKGSKVLVLNALRREHHVSHYTLEQAIELAKELKPEKAYFTHISHQLGLHSEVEKELPPGIFLAYDGLRLEL
ncbi:MAG: MBL fold metallo-hydrolase [Bacteroidetes bacterium]|nr:MBL fold metallo-hydrolase [Bacteroidota bacterium]